MTTRRCCGQAPPAAEPASGDRSGTRVRGPDEPKYAAKVPASVTTPDTVQTRIGTLKFNDGLPDAETIKKVYDNLDFARGVEAFLLGVPSANIQGMRRGYAEGGFPSNQGFGISETLADARSLFLTPNTVVVYCWGNLDVKDGPMVLEVPPGVLGILNDAHWRWVNDLGLTGPDQGKGGKYLVVPPGYKGTLPKRGVLRSEDPHLQPQRHPARLRPGQRPGDHREEREGEHQDVPAFRRGQSADDEVRELLGHADQHRPRQRFHLLRGAERGRAARAGRLSRIGSGGNSRLDRHQEGQAVHARCADEGDPHRRGGGCQRHVARDDIRLARPADKELPRPAVDHHVHALEPRVRRWRRTHAGCAHHVLLLRHRQLRR